MGQTLAHSPQSDQATCGWAFRNACSAGRRGSTGWLARELRDRWLEHVMSGGDGAMLIEDAGKYDVARALPDMHGAMKLLAA
jgi:hypothetical protein